MVSTTPPPPRTAGTAGCELPEQQIAIRALEKLRLDASEEDFAGDALVVLWGPSGCGKSFLVDGFADQQREVFPEISIRRATAAAFSAELAAASEQQAIPEFQTSWRDADICVIEDLHAIPGRRETQQQLVRAMDQILAESGRVLVTSRLSPGELKRMDRRLVNRLQGGLIAGISNPGVESRADLVRHFARRNGSEITDAAADRLARALPVSTRELSAAVERIGMEAARHGRTLDDDFVIRFLQTEIPPAGVSIPEIARAVAKHFAVSLADLRSTSRRKTCVLARQTAMYLARELTGKPLRSIGRYFSDRNHTTVMHACRRVESLLSSHPTLSNELLTIRRNLVTRT